MPASQDAQYGDDFGYYSTGNVLKTTATPSKAVPCGAMDVTKLHKFTGSGSMGVQGPGTKFLLQGCQFDSNREVA